MVEVVGCGFDEPTVVVDHPQKSLQLFDGCWGLNFAYSFYLTWQGLDAMGVADMAQELDGAFTQDALLPVDDEAILFENLEDCFQVFEVFLHGRRRDENVVEINEDVWNLAEYLVH